jgi:hypothetical protein
MPKRSNDFQRLVELIYSKMAFEGASVQESVLLKERCSTSMREVDILVEFELAGHTWRMAVECRDRSRKDDVGWIDGIIGKYKDLDVDKVVAVSRSGFSEPAKEKALANKIETITLARALTLNWLQEFMKLGIATLVLNTRLENLHLEVTPALTEKAKKSDMVIDSAGQPIATIGEIMNSLDPEINNRIRLYLNQHFFELFLTMSDLYKLLKTEQSFPVSHPIYLVDSNGVSHRIQSMTFTTISKFSVKRVPVKHYTFGEDKALVTTAVLDFANSEEVRAVNIIQIPGKKRITVSVGPPKKKRTEI